MDIIYLIAKALIFILPAYCANATPVIAGRGGLAIDFGKKFVDGKPIFGKNKTLRGFLVGLAVGTCIGLSESAVLNYPLAFGVLLSLGALLGDLGGAFLKRRLDIPPGNLLPVIDQVDFVVGALIFSLLVYPMLAWQLVLTVLIITPPIHLLTNFAAYKLRLKSNPW
jgi:CDP-2,3-bis-(O-geranylgeranyl)-sn-glycerol synthase